jgi:hypothetical protein
MNGSARAQLWLASLGAAAALGAAVVPATLQLLDDGGAAPVQAPATTLPAPTATPQEPAAGVGSARQQRPAGGRGDRRDRGGG